MSNKPFQIYPNKTQKKWMQKEAKRLGQSMNVTVLQLINKEAYKKKDDKS
jgi:hypothetical protein